MNLICWLISKPYLRSEIANGILIYRGHNSQNRPFPIICVWQAGLPYNYAGVHRGKQLAPSSTSTNYDDNYIAVKPKSMSFKNTTFFDHFY